MNQEEQLIEQISEIAQKLGWTIAIPDVDDDTEIPGMIIGVEDYVRWVTSRLVS